MKMNSNDSLTAETGAFAKKTVIIVSLISFFLPALILYVIFAANGVHPFGDKQILVTDLWHQYYPFLCEMQEKLKAGESLLYSHKIGMGTNFLALMAYYCFSPLNFLTAFFTKEALRDVLVVFVAVKIGFSGLFFSVYLRKVFSRCDFTVVAFSSAYALCGYALGYYWNIMWLDSVAMLPLVMLGVHLLIKEEKFLLYTVSLALSIIFNFYIGYMICIFTAIYFFSMCIIEGIKGKVLLRKLGLIAAFSVIAIGLTAFVTLPTYFALANSYSAGKGFPQVKFKESMIEVLGRMASFNQPVPKDGAPNIYSSLAAVALLGVFLALRKIKLREKIVSIAVMAFILFSMCLSTLNFIWHGFHTTNMVPYRYAFIFSFVLLASAYRGFDALREELESKTYRPGARTRGFVQFVSQNAVYIAAGLLTLFISLCAIGHAEVATIVGSVALGVLYFSIILICGKNKSLTVRKRFPNLICAVAVVELIINVVIAVPTVRVTTYSTYYYKGEEIEDVLEATKANESFGRVEGAQEYILNDPALYGYYGVSAFSSTANYNVTKFAEKLSICAPSAANRYYYETTSPLTNAFLGIERVIFKNTGNLNDYLVEEATSGSVSIYKNTMALPLGFMTEEDILDWDTELSDPFELQNDLFRRATGLDGDLFTRLELASVMASNVTVTGSEYGIYNFKIRDEEDSDRSFAANYVVLSDNPVYAYIDSPATDKVSILNVSNKAVKRKYIFPAGTYKAGEKITFEFTLNKAELDSNKRCNFYVYEMNQDLFEEGMSILEDEPLNLTRKDSTLVEGTVTAKDDGLMYISIPYEKGWTLYVDGKKTEMTPLMDAMIAFPLDAGDHDIKLTYLPEGFKTGVVLSVLGVVCLSAAVLMFKKRKKSIPEGEAHDGEEG